MWHAHLLEIRSFQFTVKNLVHRGVDFNAQNTLKTYQRASLIPDFFRGYPLKRRRKKMEDGRELLRHGCWGWPPLDTVHLH